MTVGVEKALIQIHAACFRKLFGGRNFALPPAGGPNHGTGELAVFYDEFRAQNGVDAEIGGGRFDLVSGCRRNYRDGVPLAQVGLHQSPRLGINLPREILLVHFVAELGVTLFRNTA
jgi:hypothetical protein